MNKILKRVTLFVMGLAVILAGVPFVSAIKMTVNQEFYLTPYFTINKTLKNGTAKSYVTWTAEMQTAIDQANAGATSGGDGVTQKYYAFVSDLSKKSYTKDGKTYTGEELYNYMKGLLDDIDAANLPTTAYTGNNMNAKVAELRNVMKTTKQINGSTLEDHALWCYLDEYTENVTVPKSCNTEYYAVSFLVNTTGVDNPDTQFNEADEGGEYNSVQVYKVAPNADNCGCRVEGNKYYDATNKEVTKEKFYNSCGCRVENGKYYDATGTETTEAKYRKACLSCKVENNKYYNANGVEITKEEYKKLCGNPETGSNNPYIISGIVLASGLAVILVLKKKKYV